MSAKPLEIIALRYHQDVHAAQQSSVMGEPEAQLTTPVAELFRAVAEEHGLGKLTFVRESRLDRVRPDFAVLHAKGGKIRQKGYVELKAPDVTVDATKWAGRNAKQWELMRLEAEVLLVCNGREARLYVNGEQAGDDATLPYDKPKTWSPLPLAKILERFLETSPRPVVSVRDLSERLARRTADLRDRLLWLYEQTGQAGDMTRDAFESWKGFVHPESSARDFADGMAQVVAYGMVLAALSNDTADADEDGHLSVREAREAIRSVSPVMAAAFGPLVDRAPLFDAVRVEVGALETLVSAIDRARVEKSADPRGETWLYFYEDFLGVYDPKARREAGVYYTPVDVVRAMTRIVDHLLVERFGIPLGFADPKVVTLDPAAGTGTFPLAVIDRAAARATERRGKGGPSQAALTLSNNLFAFELLPGPYAVTNLRLSERLKKLNDDSPLFAQVVLTDTLESPLGAQVQMKLFGDVSVLAKEQNRAKRIKAEKRITVVIGNPPYRRVARSVEGRGSGGWVVDGEVPGRKAKTSLFDDLRDISRRNKLGKHFKNSYNLYVYFWRWAIWKAFEAHGDGPGVVAFITASSWLTGDAFVGLRQVVRECCDEAWVLDLGGDNRGADRDENVFAIETPVAVVVLVRDAETNRKKPASVHYRRVAGSAEEKLAAMRSIADSDAPLSGAWRTASTDPIASFVPEGGGKAWKHFPALRDIFPLQQPGSQFKRRWPIAPAALLLEERWRLLADSSPEKRATLFQETRDRKVAGQYKPIMPGNRDGSISKIDRQSATPPIRRYGYRSFDRQWVLADSRLGDFVRPSLWCSVSDRQVFVASFMTKKMSKGPAAVASDAVPDLDFLRGSFGGSDVIPLYRDAAGMLPNVTRGLLDKISKELRIRKPSPEDLMSYVYAVLSSPRYHDRFEEALRSPGPRVPVTKDGVLWNEAVRLGRELVWLHTYAERFRDPSLKRGKSVPRLSGLGWKKAVTHMPDTSRDIDYDAAARILHVGDGRVEGVSPEVWAYEVGGMPIVKKWLGYRTAKGAGRAASSENPLEQIRPTAWLDEWNDELLDLLSVLALTIERQPAQATLLDRICDGPLIAASELPKPKDVERKPPKTD